MSIKYQCPICLSEFENEDKAWDCRDRCVERRFNVIEIDTVQAAADNPRKFTGKCETCKNADQNALPVQGCPHRGDRHLPDGCAAYEPDTLAFGMGIATEWEQMRRRG